MDGVSKGLTRTFDPLEVTWARYVFQAVVLVPVLLATGLPASRQPWRQMGRALLLLGSALLFITALSRLPMADATAVGFVAPLLVAALSWRLLREPVDATSWAAVATGFGGVVLAVRPGGVGFEAASLLPLASASCWAVAMIMTRHLAAGESPHTTLAYTTGFGLAATSLMVPWVWHSPNVASWATMAALGTFSIIGQYLLLYAFQIAPAAVLAPFQYSQIVWSTAIGYWWFQGLPDRWTCLGAAVIIASGLYIWWRRRF